MPNNFKSRFEKKNISTNIKENTSIDNNIQNDAAEIIYETPVSTDGIISNIEESFKKALYERISKTPIWHEYNLEEKNKLVSCFVEKRLLENNIDMADTEKDILIKTLTNAVLNFGVLDNITSNPKVDSVYVNSSKSVYIEIDNKILNPEITLSDEELKFILSSIKNMAKTNDFNGIKKFKTNNFVITVIGNDICKSGTNLAICKE